MRCDRTVNDLREQAGQVGDTDQPRRLRIKAALAVIAAGEGGLRWIGCALAGEQEIEPVLAMEGSGRPRNRVGHVRLKPRQLRPLLAGNEPRARTPVQRRVAIAAADLLDQPPGARVQPQQRRRNRPAIVIDQPGAVTLPGHRDCRDPCRQVRQGVREGANDRNRIAPGPRHVLHDMTAGRTAVHIRPRNISKLLAGQCERHRLDQRRAGINANDDIAACGSSHRQDPSA